MGQRWQGKYDVGLLNLITTLERWLSEPSACPSSMGFIPSTHIKVRCLHVHNSSAGEVVRVSLAKSTRSRLSQRLRGIEVGSQLWALTPTHVTCVCMCVCVCARICMCVCVCTSACVCRHNLIYKAE